MVIGNQLRRPRDIRVLVAGIPKSSVTFTTQVINDLVDGDCVYKTHAYIHDDNCERVFLVVRDFRDCITSASRSLNDPINPVSCDFIWYIMAQWQQYFWALYQYIQRQSPVIIRYETCTFDPVEFSRVTGFPVGDTIAAHKRHDFATNKHIVDNLTQHQPNGMLTCGHMHEGTMGAYKEWMGSDAINLANDLLGDHLTYFNYDV